MHAVHPDGGGIQSELTLQPFGVPGAMAVPADEAWPAETPDDEINVLEMIQRHEDVLSLLPKVTLLKIALDSGACEHVVSKSDLQGFKIEESEASRRGEHYIAADGGKVPNQGQCRVGLRAQGTGVEFDSLFQLAPVSRPLYSVGKICDGGAEVKFTAKEELLPPLRDRMVCMLFRLRSKVRLTLLRFLSGRVQTDSLRALGKGTATYKTTFKSRPAPGLRAE